MPLKIGEVAALFRYPVKSMRGELLDIADLGWHGVAGDRRLALRRTADRGGFPWLTATKLPELIRFAPLRLDGADEDLPTHVRTPEGEEFAVFSSELAAEIGRRHGAPVEMTHLRNGVFDETSISVITSASVAEIGSLAAQPADARRFRPNIVISSQSGVPFEEDAWVGGFLSFGDSTEAAAIAVTMRDERCAMINLDPDSARPAPEMLKAVVRVREKKAGVYATVTRRGRLAIGQPVFFEPFAQREP